MRVFAKARFIARRRRGRSVATGSREVGAHADLEELVVALHAHGYNAMSFQTTYPTFRYFRDGDAFIAYVDTGTAWVAASAPVTSFARFESVTKMFAERARENGRRACFFGVESRFVKRVHWPHLLVGEQATWKPEEWALSKRSSRSLREQLRRARAKGVSVRRLAHEDLHEDVRKKIDTIVAAWLARRALAPMGFVATIDPLSRPEERLFFLAEQKGELVGLLSTAPIYGRNGVLLENLIRAPDAPNGTNESLVDAAMQDALATKLDYVSLGLAPLAGDVSKWLAKFRDHTSVAFDFRGLFAFKNRLRPPRWEPVYLAFPNDVTEARAIFETLRAFANGGFLKFGVQTILRGPPLAMWALTILLVPWTLVLSRVDAHAWFPAPWVKWAWVSFDVVLAIAMFACARRFRPRLAYLLAIAVSLDTTTTLVEALTFNAPRVKSAGDAMLVVLACFAPFCASIVLWGGRARRRSVQRPRTWSATS